jgi:hypothetical protein
LSPASLTPVANLPLVLTTLAKIVAKLPRVSLIPVANSARVVDTCSNFFFAAGVVPVVHLDLRISLRIFDNSKRFYWDTLRLGGNSFMNKTRSKESRDTVLLKL